MHDMSAGIINANSHHVHVHGSGDLGREQRPGIDVRNPIQMFFVIFDGINAVERERRKQRSAHHRLAQGRDAGRVLVAQQVPAQAGLGAWAYLNSTILARCMVSSDTPKRPVATWVITLSA